MAHKHNGRLCRARTMRECDEIYAEWQASAQVALAAKVVAGEHGFDVKFHRKSNTMFDQLVLVLAGERDDFDGATPFANRVRAALIRYKQAQIAPG